MGERGGGGGGGERGIAMEMSGLRSKFCHGSGGGGYQRFAIYRQKRVMKLKDSRLQGKTAVVLPMSSLHRLSA